MRVVFRLMQESGVKGPTHSTTIREETPWPELRRDAKNWAKGQTGHPWDCLVVEFPDGENEPFDVYAKS